MNEIITKINKRKSQLHAERVEFLSELIELADKARDFSCPELVDAAILCREIARYSDELRKECEAKNSLLAKLCVARTSIELAKTQGSEDEVGMNRIKGELGSGLPDVDFSPDIPRKGSPQFQEMLDMIGVPESALDIMSINWKKLVQFTSERVKEDKPVPDWLQRLKPIFKLELRKNSNV